MAITKEQQKALANYARAANRRLERATPGQRAYLESMIARYHVRERASGAIVFKQGKAQSEAEYTARMRELRTFMGENEEGKKVKDNITSTRTGWEALKKQQIENAGKTLRKQGYTITDGELAVILQQVDEGHRSAEFYSALENVEIARNNAQKAYEAAVENARAEAIAAGRDPEAAAAKIKTSDFWSSREDEITAAINQQRADREKTELMLRIREANRKK